MPRSYNFIYRELVEDQNDIVGHIAYALYKADKIKFIEKFKEGHNSLEPTEEDLEPFHSISCIEGSLDRYKLTAVSILQRFLDYSLEDSTNRIEENCLNSHKQMLSEVISPLRPTGRVKQFLSGVAQTVVGAFVFALLLAGIGFIAVFKANDINFSITTPQGQTKSITVSPNDSIPKKSTDK